MQLNLPSFPKLALAFSVVGALAGCGASFLVTPRYVSRATIAMGGAYLDSKVTLNLTEQFLQLQNEILSRTSLSSIIQDPRLDLYRRDRAKLPLEDVIEQMRRRDTSISTTPSATSYLSAEVSFAYSDDRKAQETVQTFITKLQDANRVHQLNAAALKNRPRSYDEMDRIEARLIAIEKKLGITQPEIHQPESSFTLHPPVSVIDPAMLPLQPVFPDHTHMADLSMPQTPESPRQQEPPFHPETAISVIDPPSLPVDPIYPDRAHFMETGFAIGFASALIIAVLRRKAPPIPCPAETA